METTIIEQKWTSKANKKWRVISFAKMEASADSSLNDGVTEGGNLLLERVYDVHRYGNAEFSL